MRCMYSTFTYPEMGLKLFLPLHAHTHTQRDGHTDQRENVRGTPPLRLMSWYRRQTMQCRQWQHITADETQPSPPQCKRNEIFPIDKPSRINIDTIEDMAQHGDQTCIHGAIQSSLANLLQDHGAEVHNAYWLHVGDLRELFPNGTQDFLVEIHNQVHTSVMMTRVKSRWNSLL